jgi:dephospho-CoA kinase
LTRFIGLTGGIGAGKSEALSAAARLGAATLSTDRVAHEILDRDDLRAALVERWGKQIAAPGGVDRARVAEIVFEQPEELAWLESQTHPRVGREVADWRSGLPPGVKVAMIEVPLLFEAGLDAAFDRTLAVIAADAVREKRLAERGQGGLAGREERQLSQEQKAARADHVIHNEGTLAQLEAAIAEVLDDVIRGGSG